MRRSVSPAQGRVNLLQFLCEYSDQREVSQEDPNWENKSKPRRTRRSHEGGLPARNRKRKREANESHSSGTPERWPAPQTYPCAKVFPRTDRNHPLARSAKRLRISHLRLSYRIKFLSPVFPLRYAGSRLTICIVPQHPAVQ